MGVSQRERGDIEKRKEKWISERKGKGKVKIGKD